MENFEIGGTSVRTFGVCSAGCISQSPPTEPWTGVMAYQQDHLSIPHKIEN
jgi:hypothetical protein